MLPFALMGFIFGIAALGTTSAANKTLKKQQDEIAALKVSARLTSPSQWSPLGHPNGDHLGFPIVTIKNPSGGLRPNAYFSVSCGRNRSVAEKIGTLTTR